MKIIATTFSLLFASAGLLAQLPLCFGFDSPPTFDPQYFTPYDNWQGQNGIVDIANGNGALNTAYFARLGKSNDQAGTTVNALDLKVNLSNYTGTQLELSFWFAFFHDNTQYNDAVFMSDDGGANFVRVIALEPENWCNLEWGSFQVFDLDALIEQFNLNYTQNFIIQFRHEGTGDFNTSGDEDGLYLDEICINEAQPLQPFGISQAVSFKESFANGQFGEYWTLKYAVVDDQGEVIEGTTPNGSVQITNSNAVDGDNYSLLLGKWGDGCGAQNWSWADLHLDLSILDNSNLDFSFWFKYFHDEDQFQDGIWFSDDGGLTFTNKPVISLQPDRWENLQYGKFQTFDLDELIVKHGLSFSNDFVIRFWQVGSGDWNTSGDEDGLFIDAIEIKVVPPVVYKQIPFCDDFEVDSIFEKHWRYGYAALDENGMATTGTTPSNYTGSAAWGTGNRALLAGKFNDFNGFNLSKIDLHLNLVNASEVTLSFDYIDFYNEPQAEEGIWLSTDGGETFFNERFQELPDYPNSNNDFNSLDIPISDVAASKGIVLTDKTVLRFQQFGTGDFSTSGDEDGIVLDNVCVSGIVSTMGERFNQGSLSVFPNPAKSTLYISFNGESDDYLISVFDVSGQLVLKTFHQANSPSIIAQLGIGGLPSGCYFLQIQDGDRILSGRFFKSTH